MSKIEEKLLKMLFYDMGGRFYEVIDKDGIRKPAITTELLDVHIEGGGFNEETWTVQVNWRLLNKWFGGKNELDEAWQNSMERLKKQFGGKK